MGLIVGFGLPSTISGANKRMIYLILLFFLVFLFFSLLYLRLSFLDLRKDFFVFLFPPLLVIVLGVIVVFGLSAYSVVDKTPV